MNRKNVSKIILFGIIISSGMVFHQKEGNAVIKRALTGVINGVRSGLSRIRNVSDPTDAVSSVVKAQNKLSQSSIGDEHSDLGAIRGEKTLLNKSILLTYGAGLQDFDEPDFVINKNKWYLQYTDDQGDDVTLVSLLRPRVLSSSDGVEVDEFIDENNVHQQVVHNGIGNWIRGSAILEEFEHRSIVKLMESNSDFSGIDIPKTSGILPSDPLYAEVMYVNRFGTKRSKKGALRLTPLNSVDNIYGERIKDFDLVEVGDTINPNWWYLQYKDEYGNIKTLISSSRPEVKIVNGNEVETYIEPVTNDTKNLNPGVVGLWYMGQGILERYKR